MSPCPWGHQQTATLRLEDPRAQGSGIILACFTLRSPKSREWVQASFSEPNSCCQTGTKRKAARGTEEALCYSVLLITHHYEHFIHSLGHSSSSLKWGPGQVLGCLLCWPPKGSMFPCGCAQKPHWLCAVLKQSS